MKKLLLIALLLFCHPVQAACGFGSTFGAGTTDSIQIGSFAFPSKWSFSAWIWINGTGGGTLGRIYDAQNNTMPFFVSAGPTLSFQIPWSGTNGLWAIAYPTNSVWHHLLVTYDGTSTSNVPAVYVDGLLASFTTSVGPSGTLSTTTAVSYIGNAPAGNRNWDGKLAQEALWGGQVLTANEAVALARGASPLQIRQSSLLFYVPCYRTTAAEADWGPSHLAQTVTGTAFQPDPPVQPYPMIKYGQ